MQGALIAVGIVFIVVGGITAGVVSSAAVRAGFDDDPDPSTRSER